MDSKGVRGLNKHTNLYEEGTKVKAKFIGENTKPLVCTPLVEKSKKNIIYELEKILLKNPDIIEWRGDFFEGLADTEQVVDLCNKIKETVGDIPVIFTIRSIREGGQPISLTYAEANELNAAICTRTNIDYVDCELSNQREHIRYLRQISRESKTKLIGSFHNFEHTPCKQLLYDKLKEAEEYGMDVAKVAVMPRQLEDVLELLSATLEAKNKLKIPVITMSMGELGAVTRMIGGIFGSSLTFAVGQSTSAPGQIPIEDLRKIIDIVQKYVY
jgi:3-dehydroquinate dehydratase I